MADYALSLLGVVQVPVANLYFVKGIGGGVGERQHSTKQTQHLADLFSKTSIDHEDHKHWIDGYVDRSDVPSILNCLGGSITLHQSNAAQSYPCLPGQRVAYTHGRHRIKASQNIDPQSCWTVLLYSTDLSMLANSRVVQRRTEQFHHEEPYTDGYIYCKLFEYRTDQVAFDSWHMMLSENKRKNFDIIPRHSKKKGQEKQGHDFKRPPDVRAALDRLTRFPGLIDGLQLGNFCKYSAWGLFSEAEICLHHIADTWENYCSGNFQRCITPRTVELLEGRAPAISESDHEWVRTVFQARMVFPAITDQQRRDELENKILRTSGMIPSLRFFQANMLYLGIAAQIVWTLLIPKELKKMVSVENGGWITLQSALRKCWVETQPYVEIREGEFQPVRGPPDFNLAYSTVIVAALRQFVYMAKDRTKIERGEPAPRLSISDIHSCESLFQRRAKLLGFRNYLIDQGAAERAAPFRPEQHALEPDEDFYRGRVDRRWGRPFTRVFPVIQEVCFLPRLLREEENSGKITEVFVLKELLRTFLPHCSFSMDLSRRSILINSPPLEIGRQLVDSDHRASTPDRGFDDSYSLAESTEMDIDTPMASPDRHILVDDDDDVLMEDHSLEQAEAEKSEDSDFWEQLLLEYQTNAGTSSRSSRPASDASTLVRGALSDSESPLSASTACESSSAFSIPSYSMVADQSRTIFDDSSTGSQRDGSTIWSQNGSDIDPAYQHSNSWDAVDIYTRKLGTDKKVYRLSSSSNHSIVLPDHKNTRKNNTSSWRQRKPLPELPLQADKLSRRQYKPLPEPQPQADNRPSRRQDRPLLELLPQVEKLSRRQYRPLPDLPPPSDDSAELYGSSKEKGFSVQPYAATTSPPQHERQDEIAGWWGDKSPASWPHVVPRESGHDSNYPLPSVYSTTPERSALPSPSGYRALESQKAAMASSPHSNRRFTTTSFYTSQHPRSILPSPVGDSQTPRRPQMGHTPRGPWRGSSTASSAKSYNIDLSESGSSRVHSHSTLSPILPRFSQNGRTPGWGDDSFQYAPAVQGGNPHAFLRVPQEQQQEELSEFADSEGTLTTISLS
ncbi:hypothetical protein FDECE_12013 [Fusarium decemcellulare]|nr:hypothetical protein FDECE_12013 [Fusarium decemcellulare]